MESDLKKTTSSLLFRDKLDHFLARLAFKRSSHIVEPGLYKIGEPDKQSHVFVSANYTLSFDALRSSLKGLNAYILVLDTKGVNVWCAAGKKTFGTEELLSKIASTKLDQIVEHKKIILPQLGAPGISAHEIRTKSGFRVEYGPVRATDIPMYLKTGISKEMRKVNFPLKERMVLIPVELVLSLIPALILGIGFYFLGGITMAMAFFAAAFAGIVLFPILLPHLPTYNFSSKGFFLGILTSIPFAILVFLNQEYILWQKIIWALSYLLIMPSFTSFISLNFTGSTTFASRHGVKQEIFRYFPVMAYSAITGLVLSFIVLIISNI